MMPLYVYQNNSSPIALLLALLLLCVGLPQCCYAIFDILMPGSKMSA